MNFLEQALNKNAQTTNKEVLENPHNVPQFNEQEISKRIAELETIIAAGGKYSNKDNQIVIDAYIEELNQKIQNADERADVTVLKKELDDYLFTKESAAIQEESFKEKEELEQKLKDFLIENTKISN